MEVSKRLNLDGVCRLLARSSRPRFKVVLGIDETPSPWRGGLDHSLFSYGTKYALADGLLLMKPVPTAIARTVSDPLMTMPVTGL